MIALASTTPLEMNDPDLLAKNFGRLELGLKRVGILESKHDELPSLTSSVHTAAKTSVVGEVIKRVEHAHEVAAISETDVVRIGVDHADEVTETMSVERSALGSFMYVVGVKPGVGLDGRGRIVGADAGDEGTIGNDVRKGIRGSGNEVDGRAHDEEEFIGMKLAGVDWWIGLMKQVIGIMSDLYSI